MNTVIIVNLNGNAFHLEESGIQSLRAYLERAQAQLRDNPDKTEIVADLEQAIADKCAQFVSPHKNVVSAAEIAEILRQMGPVESDVGSTAAAASDAGPAVPEAAAASNSAAASGPAPKRLYQIREGAMFSGVCTGLAAYFNIDVIIVRILFVVVTVFSGGLFTLAYVAMMLVIPFANTGEERAAAAGAPFNAQELIDRAKKQYADFQNGRDWRAHWREQRREWRMQRREWRRRWKFQANRLNPLTGVAAVPATGYAGQVFAGLMIPILAVARTLAFCAFLVIIASLATTGTLLGWPVMGSLPLWVAMLLTLVVYSAFAAPLKLTQRAMYLHTGGYQYHWVAAWDAVLSLGVFALVCWLAYWHVPQVHEFFQHLPENLQLMWDNFINSIPHAHTAQSPSGASSTFN